MGEKKHQGPKPGEETRKRHRRGARWEPLSPPFLFVFGHSEEDVTLQVQLLPHSGNVPALSG